MLTYKDNLIFVDFHTVYKQSLRLEGMAMEWKNADFKSENLQVSASPFEYLNMYLIFNQLNSIEKFIEEKVTQYLDYAKTNAENEDIRLKAEFLANWSITSKKANFADLLQAISFNKVKRSSLETLPEFLVSYRRYFEIVDAEPNENDRFEETFSIISQLPVELQDYLEVDMDYSQADFVSNCPEYKNCEATSSKPFKLSGYIGIAA